jgi:hypothetical protein
MIILAALWANNSGSPTNHGHIYGTCLHSSFRRGRNRTKDLFHVKQIERPPSPSKRALTQGMFHVEHRQPQNATLFHVKLFVARSILHSQGEGRST